MKRDTLLIFNQFVFRDSLKFINQYETELLCSKSDYIKWVPFQVCYDEFRHMQQLLVWIL